MPLTRPSSEYHRAFAPAATSARPQPIYRPFPYPTLGRARTCPIGKYTTPPETTPPDTIILSSAGQHGPVVVPILVKKGLIQKFLNHVVPGVVRPLHALWNEVIGFVFVALGVLMVRTVWRGFHELDNDPASLSKLCLSVFFCVTMLGFGAHSFWRARRISRGTPPRRQR
jgi:hypothetical protein